MNKADPTKISGLHPSVRKRLLREITAQFKLKGSLHGPTHWMRVRENGLKLAQITGADKVVVELFAMLHDCRRTNDGREPEHGENGGLYARYLCESGQIKLTNVQMGKLFVACRDHSLGLISGDSTIGTCWDADRLDLYRVGIYPDTNYLSTSAAKDPHFIIKCVERTERATKRRAA